MSRNLLARTVAAASGVAANIVVTRAVAALGLSVRKSSWSSVGDRLRIGGSSHDSGKDRDEGGVELHCGLIEQVGLRGCDVLASGV
jgi:hypothetical protein